MDEPKKNAPIPADVVMGLVIFFAGGAMAGLSLTYRHGEVWYLAPSLMPLAVFGSLALMGLRLAVTAGLSLKGAREKFARAPGKDKVKGAPASIFLLGLLLLYYAVLPRFLPFELCTGLYLVAAFRLLWKTASWPKAVVTAAIAAAAFSVTFSSLFKVVLPGVTWEDFLASLGLFF